MGSPSRLYHTFVDADDVRWGVEAQLLGEGADAIPVRFAFTSQYGEHRRLDGVTPECVSWEQFCDTDWCQLLLASRTLHGPLARRARTRYQGIGHTTRW
jgi:hypothetical protein